MVFCYRCGKRNPEGAQNCSNCGCNLSNPVVETKISAREQAAEETPCKHNYAAYDIFSDKRKWVIAGVVAVLVLVIMIIAFGCVGKKPVQFKMNGAGDLYFDGQAQGGRIEIPREYDGQASGLEDPARMTGLAFSYKGSLKTFTKYHDWVFSETYARHEISKMVYCEDYQIEFSVNGSSLGADVSYKDDMAQLIHPMFIIYDNNGEKIESFERLSEVCEWLDEN